MMAKVAQIKMNELSEILSSLLSCLFVCDIFPAPQGYEERLS